MWHSCPMSLTPSTMVWIKQAIFAQNSSSIKFHGKYEVALVNCIIKVHMKSWEKIVHMIKKLEPLTSLTRVWWQILSTMISHWLLYPTRNTTICMSFVEISTKISSRNKYGFTSNYSTEQRRIYLYSYKEFIYTATVSAIGWLGFFALHCPLLKNIVLRFTTDFSSSALHDWGSGNNFEESVSQNLRCSARSLCERLKSHQSGKGLKRARHTSSLISLNSGRKRETSLLLKKKKKPKIKIVRSKKDFFF